MSKASLDTTDSIFRSAARFFSGTMLSRISGMLRDMCMAYAFGTKGAVAALLVAFRLAHLLRRLLGEGAMQTALIPYFEELRKESPRRAGAFFRDLSVSLSLLLIFIIAAAMAGLGTLLAFDMLSSGNQEILWLTFLMMPSLLFICLFGINASLLQCEKSYFAPSAAPVAFNLLWIVGIFFCRKLPIVQAMNVLSFFIIAACFAQWVVTLPKTYAILQTLKVGSLWRGGTYDSKDVLRLGKPLALGITGVAAAQINNALDAVFARWADPEGPAFLWYAIRLQQLPLALFGVALAGALLPPLARAVKANSKAQSRQFLDFAMRRALAVMLPITFGLFVAGDGCVHLIFGYGDFNQASMFGTTQALWGYTFGLIPMALVLVLAPAFYAAGNYRTPAQASIAAMVVNVGLNTVLVAGLGLGAASVAAATSVSAWVNFFWLAIAFEEGREWFSQDLFVSIGKIAFVSALASLAIVTTDYFIWGNVPAFAVLKGNASYHFSSVQQLVRLGIDGCMFAAVLVGTAFAVSALTPLSTARKEEYEKI